MHNDSATDYVSATADIESFFLEKKAELNKFELNDEFCIKRGWSDRQLYTAIKKSELFKAGKYSYIHPSAIKWNAAMSRSVYQILDNFLINRTQKQIPHAQLTELVEDDHLPELPNDIFWNKQLLISIGEELEEFIFFDDAFIFTDNEFNIEDLDDMIGFLINRNFSLGIAKKNEVEKLLWREGILEIDHSIPSNQFFEDSSIEFLEMSDEICLSPIGKSKYDTEK